MVPSSMMLAQSSNEASSQRMDQTRSFDELIKSEKQRIFMTNYASFLTLAALSRSISVLMNGTK